MEEEDDTDGKFKRYKIIVSGLLIHFLLLLAVFDVYFASPIDHGMSPVLSTLNPPAKRLVLFVADGLRAEAIFGKENEKLAPFLTHVLKNEGSWGLAHTRVPTESRPGHVAMLAGIYEDPSAILKGWKSNPVNFDSVINQSTNAWAWGSPDIVTIFNRDKLPNIHIHSYDSRIEDFGKNDTGLLDTWVFQKVDKFLKTEIATCIINCKPYYAQGNIYFLHLLGIDTAGHGYKPHSREYKNNIKLVDSNVERISKLFNSIYKDNLTAFVFTADHGMTDWGSHGAGTNHETEVPLVAWGAGIRKNHLRRDVNQIDIAPLLSSLIGINIPINSLGILPVDYIDSSTKNLRLMLFSNVLELASIFDRKRKRTKKHALIYLPYKNVDDGYLNEELSNLLVKSESMNDDDIETEKYEKFMNFLIDGINYYHNYYQYPVLITVSLGFIVWIVFLYVSIFDVKNSEVYNRSNKFVIPVVIVITVLCAVSNFNFSYYLYFNFPFLAYFILLRDKDYTKLPFKLSVSALLQTVYYLVGLELLVYGFFNRASFTVVMILVATWVTVSKSLRDNSSRTEKICWIICSLVLSVFPCLPVMKTAFNVPMYLAGYTGYLIMFAKIYFVDLKYYKKLENVNFQYNILLVQFFFLHLSVVYIFLIEFQYISSDSNWKYLSWLITLIPLLVIPLTDRFIALRLISTVFGFAPFYLLVSPNYEVLCSVFYIFLLYTWLLIESKTFRYKSSHKIIYFLRFDKYNSRTSICSDDFRRAFLFMAFIFVGFFGTGYIASMNSFDPMWVRAFLTIFSPFKMMGLILLKFTVPFIFSCSIFRAINEIGKLNVMNIFCIILIFSDLMVLQFLYLITNVGSWLDIGSSLSHFIIMEAFVTVLLLLYGVAYLLTTVNYRFK
ncbi:GPI ethanolamine phosphate transferase 1-like [Diorhabda sublineata]|uniref:GPI ethanolamine phosphate transferase 1-like n=1 Tax=Diorhabda sublineata TaxID=1163346 RepID=UPI0024E0AA7E|nr:GPI ethanolamine phosphate transferase 1-like [Diorhabda sublineata]